ncbi:MAG: glycosyltransferase family 9 protein [Candidatus Eiseniibacteriota bacterium]|nr:MAG: glycosyltransferase family 9 protein [Candidatus Eisenbacteria bacterium]
MKSVSPGRSSAEDRGVPPREGLPLFPEVALKRPRSILVLRPGAMGDVLLTTPALEALRAGFPDSRISALVTPSGEAILRGNPNVDEVIVLDKSSLRSQAGVIPLVRRRGFELVVDFLCNPRTAFITLLSGAPYRLGYDVRVRRAAYNLVKPRDEYQQGKKVVKYAAAVNVDMVTCLGVESRGTRLHFNVSGRADARTGEFLRSASLEDSRLVGISPSGSWPAKTWAVGKFAELGDLIRRETGRRIVIVWGPGEEGLAAEMAQRMREESVLAPKTDVDEVGALLRRCELFVSNDSGLKHIAVALGTPTVTVFGPTNPETWNPPDPKHKAVFADVECLFCDKNDCESMVCMKELAAASVFRAARELLEEATGGPGG